jgi:hypothetical protein
MAEITRRHVLLGGVGLAALSISGSFEVDAADGDLASYADLLARYVVQSDDGINRVDYAAWHASPKNRQELAAFIANQSRLTPSTMKPSERFAFWTNLYNALTLAVVLDAYPVNSIKDIKSKGRLFDFKGFLGPWRTKLVTVEGRRMSLDDIEHGTMRPEFRDPRIHYAVNCASIGCPNLLVRPWQASSLEADLDEAARAYINHPRGVTVRSDGALKVSSLYKWYAEDFGSTDASTIGHLRRYAGEPLAARLAAATRIAADDYDWSLNDSRRLS